MKRHTVLAMTAVAVLALAVLGAAQQPAVKLLPFKASMGGAIRPFFPIPVTPPVNSIDEAYTGQADLLGAFKFVGHFMGHEPVDGTTAAITEGLGVMTAANGDAIFMTYSGLFSQTSPSTGVADLAFFVTGGQGKFLGATGSGVAHDEVDFAKNKITRTLQGAISTPKP